MKNKDIELWAKIYNDTFPLKESVNIPEQDIAENMSLVIETPGGFTEMTLNGEWDTNLWLVDLISNTLRQNAEYRRSVNFYVKK